ncbi:MAG TPA: UPF0104 family protein [Methanobacteriales archaeon]|nr:MAG: hypothetical protein XD44_1341 [Methanobacteriaceae archaeon 41_258]HIH62505.1 UPF0104 family protein [Methanobacteriales archaeon]
MKKLYVFILSLILLLILIGWVGPSNVIYAFLGVRWLIIILAIIVHFIIVFIRSLRWGFIIDKKRSYVDNFIVKTIGLFAGNLSPMRSAGEIINALAGKKINKIPISRGLSAGLTERFFDLGIAGSLLIIAALFIPMIRWIALIGGSISILLTALIYLVNWKEGIGIRLYDRIHRILERSPIAEKTLDNIYDKITVTIINIIEHTKSYSSRSDVLIIFSLSLLSWLMECIRLYLVFLAFGVHTSFFVIVIIFLLANFIGVISMLPGGLGSIEISLTTLFILFQIPANVAGSIALMDRIISFWMINFLGLIFSGYYAGEILEDIKLTLDIKG